MEDIYQTYLVAQEKSQLEVAMQELSAMNPPPMNTMLERQAREEAIMKKGQKGKERQSKMSPKQHLVIVINCNIET